jgi:hypothetical protein
MGVPNLEVGYTLATTGRGEHEVHKGHVVALKKKALYWNQWKKSSGFLLSTAVLHSSPIWSVSTISLYFSLEDW